MSAPAAAVAVAVAVAAVMALPGTGLAASLTVSPIAIEAAPAATSVITLRNHEPRPLNAQIRVFRWTQVDGADRLVPATDVVASPPIVSIRPNEDYSVRIERAGSDDSPAESAYRVVVDELPNPNRQRNGTVAIVLRYLVPAFFLGADATQPKVSWSIEDRGRGAVLVATNRGDKRLQVVDLKIKTGVKTVVLQKGLAGYVLGHSERCWPLGPGSARLRSGTVTASSDHGPVNVPLSF